MHPLATEVKGRGCLVIGGHGIFSRHVEKILQQARIKISTKLYTHMPVHTNIESPLSGAAELHNLLTKTQQEERKQVSGPCRGIESYCLI
ncbi:hypothetical protein BDV40DRAFT_183331 [Aspergillus tamarii]|uniref:Uncharacterized protein n=1 Tax=Aspergillus tamarii TaxID=41984 RepID=A0A5N6US66_ASPTM|nr:hypothetical protein BDV40DRAFT_183331 [Aspergillus tamarii]